MAEVRDEITESILDYRYFKFRKIDKYLVESLVNSSLYFSEPEKFNDPFDCQLDLRKSWERAASSSTGRVKEWLQGAIDNPGLIDTYMLKAGRVGICSFSLNLDSPLSASVLWSHYADEHKGACFLYCFPESFLIDPKNEIIGIDKVKYEEEPLRDWLKTDAMNLANLEMNKFLFEYLPKIYFATKSPAWEYENEARIIRLQPGLLKIPQGFLEQVCFGLRTPPADVGLVTKLAEEYCGCNRFCRIVRDDGSAFGIKAVEI